MGRFVIRLSLALPFAVALGLAGATAYADDSATPAAAPIDAPKAPAKAKKASHKDAAAKPGKPQQSAEDADKAARLEEGRKKFFQRSMGFDNGGGSSNPVTLQGSEGLTPAMGLKF
jgi:hypothetical protein